MRQRQADAVAVKRARAERDAFALARDGFCVTALRNATLQGAYLIMAARALGLDCGPMSGFDAAAVEAAVAELKKLGADFGRFQSRMDNLAKHIEQAKNDVDEVHVSSRKISERFSKIERVELEDGAAAKALGPYRKG